MLLGRGLFNALASSCFFEQLKQRRGCYECNSEQRYRQSRNILHRKIEYRNEHQLVEVQAQRIHRRTDGLRKPHPVRPCVWNLEAPYRIREPEDYDKLNYWR